LIDLVDGAAEGPFAGEHRIEVGIEAGIVGKATGVDVDRAKPGLREETVGETEAEARRKDQIGRKGLNGSQDGRVPEAADEHQGKPIALDQLIGRVQGLAWKARIRGGGKRGRQLVRLDDAAESADYGGTVRRPPLDHRKEHAEGQVALER